MASVTIDHGNAVTGYNVTNMRSQFFTKAQSPNAINSRFQAQNTQSKRAELRLARGLRCIDRPVALRT
jgi:hypothetical protein